jgi:hypothetical protein
MRLAETTVAEMKFERVHRMGAMTAGKVRRVVAKFHAFKDKELVRKNGRALQGTNFSVYEQYPNDVVEKRRRLLPRMKAARDEGKRAWLSYDTLFIEGKAVRD